MSKLDQYDVTRSICWN